MKMSEWDDLDWLFVFAMSTFISLGVFMGYLMVTVPEAENEHRRAAVEACERRGGELVEVYKSDDLCVKKGYVIHLKDKKI